MSAAPSWVRYGTRHGWLVRGTVPAKELAGGDFWARAVRVTCIAEGGNVDMVQCYDAGIFTAGPLGATAAFGTLARLLVDIPGNLREQYLGPLCEEHGLGLCDGVFRMGLRPATSDDLRRVFLGNADPSTWGPEDPEARRAREWTEAFAAMLGDRACLRGVAIASGKILASYLTPEAVVLLGATPMTRATACFLSFAINNPRGAIRLLTTAGPDADRMLDMAQHAGPWPETFGQRVGRTRAALDAEQW